MVLELELSLLANTCHAAPEAASLGQSRLEAGWFGLNLQTPPILT